MTRDELVTRLRLAFENDVYYQNIDFTDSIQDGIDEVAAFTGCILKQTTATFVAKKTYYYVPDLVEDAIGIYAIFNKVTRRWLVPISSLKLDSISDRWDTLTGAPEFFSPLAHKYFALYKKPSAAYGDMVVFYRAMAPTLGGSDTIPTPTGDEVTLESYVDMDLLEQRQEFTKASARFKIYMDNLSKLRTHVNESISQARIPTLHP